MNNVLASLKALVSGVLANEPALVTAVVAAVVGIVAGAFGIVVPVATVGQIAAYVVALLASAVAVRSRVTPTK